MMKKKRTIIISVSIILVLIITFIVISFFRNESNFFIMKADNDTVSYQSNEYSYNSGGLFCSRHLSYDNGKLIVKNRNGDNITTYSPDGKESVSVPKDSQMVNNKLFYLQDNTLYCKDTDSQNSQSIDSGCDKFVVSNEFVAYEKEKKVYIAEINGFKTRGAITIKNDIFYLTVIDNSLYLIETSSADTDSSTEYIFSKYNLNNLNVTKSVTKHFINDLKYVAVCNDKFYFYYDETKAVHGFSLDDDKDTVMIPHDDVVDITSNNKNVFFVSEKTEYKIVRVTVESESNGIWMIDGKDGKVKKISDKCTFDNILATDNYIYGYKIIYSLPRGMDTMFAIGFSIDQMSIS